MVPALVLTAGLATRLRPLSFVRAKAALPVAGTPLIRRILRSLSSAGVLDVVLNLHHLPHTLTRLLGDGAELGMRIRYSWEVPVLGSAGGPKRALPLLSNPEPRVPSPGSRVPDRGTFLIVNGDTLTDVNLAAVVDDHRRSGALVTMAVVPNTEPEKYSGVRVTPDGEFAGWVPRAAQEPSYHFIGVQVAEAAAFDSVAAGIPSEVRTLYSALIAAQPGSVRAFRTRAAGLLAGKGADWCSGYLSGLLVGTEIGGHRDWLGAGSVPLIGSARFGRLYGAALKTIGIDSFALDAADATIAGLKEARAQ